MVYYIPVEKELKVKIMLSKNNKREMNWEANPSIINIYRKHYKGVNV